MRLVLASLVVLVLVGVARANVDHSAFDRVLKKFVDEHGMVNYDALKDDDADLRAYLDQLAKLDVNALPRDEQLATLINAYNALTLKLIIDHGIPKSIKDIAEKDRWFAVRWDIGGKLYSLDQIEHQWIRPTFNEPRIHFALVCAAVSCPPLRREAYTGEKLEEQLEDQMRLTHGVDTRWIKLDGSTLRITKLYDWFKKDFPNQDAVSYIARYVPEVSKISSPTIEFLDYDWSLNRQPR